MKTRLPQLLVLLAGTSLLLAADGLGQVAPPPAPPAPAFVDPTTGLPIPPRPPEPIRFSEGTEKKRVEARFEGLPLTEVVVWLEQTFPDVNFVLPQSVADLNPSVRLRLRAAGLHDILEAINIATDGVVVSEVRSPTLVALLPRPEFGGGGAGGLPPFVGQALSGSPAEPPRLSYQVMNLKELMRIKDDAKIPPLLDTIRDITHRTLDIMTADSPGPRPRPLIKAFDYHPGSGVLVVIGQPEAIKLAMEVMRSMRLQDTADGGGGGGRNTEPGERKLSPRSPTGDAK